MGAAKKISNASQKQSELDELFLSIFNDICAEIIGITEVVRAICRILPEKQ
jgi:hypothetical protein